MTLHETSTSQDQLESWHHRTTFWIGIFFGMLILSSSTKAGRLTDQLQSKNAPDGGFFFARAWHEEVTRGVSTHTLKDALGGPHFFVDVAPVLQTDGPHWKWGGPTPNDEGLVTEVGVQGGNDFITVMTNIQHLTGTHMDDSAPNPNQLPINLLVVANQNDWVFDFEVRTVEHDDHHDVVVALLGALSQGGNIEKYDLHFFGRHEARPPPPRGPHPSIGIADLDFVEPGVAGASAVWGVVDNEIHMVLGGASSFPIEINSARINGPTGETIVDFTDMAKSEHEGALLANVQAGLSEPNVDALLKGMFSIEIATDQGSFSGQMIRVGESRTTEQELISAGQDWFYFDEGLDQGSSWRDVDFDDSTWMFGPAPLGYGNGNENTTLSFGSDPNNRYPTTYFRTNFHVDDASQIDRLQLDLLRDDGAAVYINGVEVARDNLASDAGFDTVATMAAEGIDETVFHPRRVPANVLVDGENLIAVELHHAAPDDDDLSFDLRLMADILLPALTCDFDRSGLCDVVDIDQMYGVGDLSNGVVVTPGTEAFDLNGDSIIDVNDVDRWLAVAATENGFAAPYLRGDANLDGVVNAVDLNAIGMNWQQSPNTWSGGDFRSYGIVNATDLNELGGNWQRSIPLASSAGAVVPEPSSMQFLAILMFVLCGYRLGALRQSETKIS